jgi:MFS family permease
MKTLPESPAAREALHRRTLRVLVGAQILAGAGLAAGVTVGALLAEDMLGSTGYAGVPVTLFTLGSAAAALSVGRVSQRAGRRSGLAVGYAVGALGGAGIVLAAAIDNVALLFISLLLYGSGTATNLQARFAGADLVAPGRRARAVATVLVATTLGAVVGPNLVEATGSVAEGVDVPRLAGPFMLATVAYAAAAVAVLILLRPDPLLTARAWAATERAEDASRGVAQAPPAAGSPAAVRVAAVALIVTQIVMVAVMTMTPIHMRDHGHSLGATGLVISIHVAAMFLPSPLTGILADRVGRRPVIAAGGIVLLTAGVVGAVAPEDSMVVIAVALGLLGLGWNLGLVGGTALLTDATPLETRAGTQGSVDLGVALAGAGAGLGSGFVVASTSYAVLSLAGGVFALVILPLLLREPSDVAPDEATDTAPALPV